MLRFEIRNSDETWRIMLEGRLTGDDAEHLQIQITRCPVSVKLIVDLTEVVFIDNVRGTGAFVSRTVGSCVRSSQFLYARYVRAPKSFCRSEWHLARERVGQFPHRPPIGSF